MVWICAWAMAGARTRPRHASGMKNGRSWGRKTFGLSITIVAVPPDEATVGDSNIDPDGRGLSTRYFHTTVTGYPRHWPKASLEATRPLPPLPAAPGPPPRHPRGGCDRSTRQDPQRPAAVAVGRSVSHRTRSPPKGRAPLYGQP